MTKPRRSRKKKISLTEFKAWLEGVEELHPADWSPTPEQWKLIRDKIQCIVEPDPEPVTAPQPHMPTPPGGPFIRNATTPPGEVQQSTLERVIQSDKDLQSLANESLEGEFKGSTFE